VDLSVSVARSGPTQKKRRKKKSRLSDAGDFGQPPVLYERLAANRVALQGFATCL